MAWCLGKQRVGIQTSGQNIKGENRFENGAHQQLSPVGCVKAMWRYATRSASKQSVVCSGSRVTNSTVMKLHGSDNRGGITVKCIQRALAHIDISVMELFSPQQDCPGETIHSARQNCLFF